MTTETDPVNWPTLYKKAAANGLYMHIYEHVVSNRLVTSMFKYGQLLLIDYDLWAHVFNRTFVLETRFHTKEAKEIFDEAFNTIDGLIGVDECKKAVLECSCEHERPYDIDVALLIPELNKIADTPWRKEHDFAYDIEDKIVSVASVYKGDGITYKRRTPGSFTEITFEYEVPACIFIDKPQLMPLAMVLIQALSIPATSLIPLNNAYYHTGDEWDEGAQRVAYHLFVRFANKRSETLNDLKNYTLRYVSELQKRDFCNKIQRLLKHNYKHDWAQHFSQKFIHATTGVILGAKGWADIATTENVQLLLDNLSIRIIGSTEEVQFKLADGESTEL
jgi:hypothetical protein